MTLTPRYSPSGPVLAVSTGAFGPIYQQFWLDTTKPDGGNGSIATPFNTWAGAVGAFSTDVVSSPTIITFAQEFDASGTPIPNLFAGGHETPTLKLQGNMQTGVYGPSAGNVITGLVVEAQDGNNFILNLVNLVLIGAAFPAGINLALTAENSIVSSLSETAPSVSGFSYLVDCSINSIALPSWGLRMQGGTVDSGIDIDTGFLDNVEFLSSADFRYRTSLNLINCSFQAGVIIRCSANQQLNLDLTSWGSMVAAGATFPDTFPQMTITPWVPLIGQVLKGGNTTCTSGGITIINAGVIAPQEAEKNTACVASFGNVQNSKLIVVGASINASRELVVLVSNVDVVDHNLVDVLFTTSYLPRLSP